MALGNSPLSQLLTPAPYRQPSPMPAQQIGQGGLGNIDDLLKRLLHHTAFASNPQQVNPLQQLIQSIFGGSGGLTGGLHGGGIDPGGGGVDPSGQPGGGLNGVIFPRWR